jgi:hypothetical protein
VERANSFRPDIAVVTGDLVENRLNEGQCAKLLSGLRASRGAYVIFGSHDEAAGLDRLREALMRAGLRVLENEAADIGDGWWIVGIEDNSQREVDLSPIMSQLPQQREGMPGQGIILLAHSPDIMDQAEAKGISLVLSGHTHGGQVRLPIIGPVIAMGRYGRRYSCGLYRVGGTWLYVNRGVGTYLLRMRFLCRPEVAILELRPAGREAPGQ